MGDQPAQYNVQHTISSLHRPPALYDLILVTIEPLQLFHSTPLQSSVATSSGRLHMMTFTSGYVCAINLH